MPKYIFDEIAFNSKEKKKPEESDKMNYIGLEHLVPGSFEINQYGSDVTPTGEKLIMKKGDILFGKRRAYQRKVAISPCDGIFSAHGMVLRPKTDFVDPDFFPWFIYSDQFMERAVQISVGGLSPTINWSDLKVQEFELPTISEQKELATKLWAAYSLKESYNELLVALREMVKSQFIEMFGWEDSILLSHLAQYTIGLTYKPADISDDGIIVLRSGNIHDGKIDLSDIVRVSCPIKTGLFASQGDILMCSRNGSASLVGKTAIIPEIEEDLSFGAFMTIIRSEYSEYLNAFFQTHLFRDQIKAGKSSTMNQITQKMLDSIRVPFPKNKKSLDEFSAFARQADKSEFELKQAIESIDKVIKSLINQQ